MIELSWSLVAVFGALFWVSLAVIWSKDRSRKQIGVKKNLNNNGQRKRFQLENHGGNQGWTYKTGKLQDTKLDFLGGCKGRSTWMPGKDDQDSFDGPDFPFKRNDNANSADLNYRYQMLQRNPAKTFSKDMNTSFTEQEKASVAALRGSNFYRSLQTEEGFWPGDYGGPMFLLPGLVIACHVTNVDLGNARKCAMLRYIMNHQQDDGGWGTHIEGHSTVFGSTLNYTAARLLGLEKSDPRAVKGRDHIKSMGGAVAAPQWAKFWLATLGAYEWTGVNPTPPELWLLPYWFPFHPGRMWCHCRMVYLPMSALFGSRYVYEHVNEDETVLSLREELFATKYEEINWGSFAVRECIAETDLYNPQSWLMTFANHLLHNTLENPILRTMFAWPLDALRKRALDFAYSYVFYEDKHTNYIDIGPVSKAFHIVATYARFGPDSLKFQRHISRIDDYLWLAEDGMKMQGYNGSMFWDTCFATHAISHALQVANESHAAKDGIDMNEINECFTKCTNFVDDMQVREDVEDRHLYFRDKSIGGWPFSTRDHGWPISDCTAEGIKAAILLNHINKKERFTQERIEQAIKIVLDLQNLQTDNGWASYELNRGYDWYELLNPAQVFGDIMIDYSYVECTSACVQALCEFYHEYREQSEYAQASKVAAIKGTDFIVNKQRPDGSWYGSWAVCFTYAAWFGIEGLGHVLLHLTDALTPQQKQQYSQAMKKGCDFLLQKQNQDGGWGEQVEACAVQEWVQANESQVVNTSWSVLALVRAYELTKDPTMYKSIQKAITFLISKQKPDGDWDQQLISGVFNKSCAISYTAYRNVFPIWALARFAQIKQT